MAKSLVSFSQAAFDRSSSIGCVCLGSFCRPICSSRRWKLVRKGGREMLLILVLVFVGVFIVITLLLVAGGTNTSQRTERALANLDAALASGRMESRDQVVDIRKDEMLSAIPLINRWLLKIELAPRLRTTLYQAGLKWTAGQLLLMSVVC